MYIITVLLMIIGISYSIYLGIPAIDIALTWIVAYRFWYLRTGELFF